MSETMTDETDNAVLVEDVEVLDLGSSTSSSDAERIALFKLDGETYTVPAEPKASMALRYLYDLRRTGPDAAAGRLLEEMLGEDAYLALMNSDITMAQLGQVMKAAETHVLGGIEQAMGND